eukprot:CAMPEP_0195531716 /NCGR_PEP_ID=MMETSP0794_2-20130614/36119_1 /TAXON_ID=515487 /ORGANISM="Stephanopyxis turris, Strain CCMP 815" /LENGTH=112 /DNA_ID=CAMNT_0040663615 /DNA_START=137 /DNA_END=471 /DNA_ORIENTATION=-
MTVGQHRNTLPLPNATSNGACALEWARRLQHNNILDQFRIHGHVRCLDFVEAQVHAGRVPLEHRHHAQLHAVLLEILARYADCLHCLVARVVAGGVKYGGLPCAAHVRYRPG